MVGVPGSGKTTIARDRFGDALRLSPDDLRVMLTGVPFELRRERIVEKVSLAALETLLALACRQGFDVLHDATNLRRESRRRLIKLARDHGVAAMAIFVRCDLETALARNSGRSRLVPAGIIRRMFSSLEQPTLDEGFQEVIEIEC